MPLDFPSSPTNGQVYEQYVYDSALPGWRSKGGAVAATYTSDTAPSGAVKGDMWYRTSDGTTFVYVVDADTSQWVEIRSEISTARVGLVPVSPSSVSVSSGTSSVGGDGTITFTGVTSIAVDGIFTSAYRHYRMIYAVTGAFTQTHAYRFRTNGVDNSASSYYFQEFYSSIGSSGVGGWANANQGRMSYSIAGYRQTMTIDIINPYVSEQTEAICLQGSATPNNWFTANGFAGTTSFTGINMYLGSGANALTGTLKIYGYN